MIDISSHDLAALAVATIKASGHVEGKADQASWFLLTHYHNNRILCQPVQAAILWADL